MGVVKDTKLVKGSKYLKDHKPKLSECVKFSHIKFYAGEFETNELLIEWLT